MKLVFFSTNRLEVEGLGKEFAEAGIPCEVRDGTIGRDAPGYRGEVELWIQKDGDCHRAFMLCVERNAGFAKRERSFPGSDLCDESQAA